GPAARPTATPARKPRESGSGTRAITRREFGRKCPRTGPGNPVPRRRPGGPRPRGPPARRRFLSPSPPAPIPRPTCLTLPPEPFIIQIEELVPVPSAEVPLYATDANPSPQPVPAGGGARRPDAAARPHAARRRRPGRNRNRRQGDAQGLLLS